MPKNGMRARMARRQRRRQWSVRNIDSFPRLMQGLGSALEHVREADFSQVEARERAHLISDTPSDPSLTTGRLPSAPEHQELPASYADETSYTDPVSLTSAEKTAARRQRQNEKRKAERAAKRAQS